MIMKTCLSPVVTDSHVQLCCCSNFKSLRITNILLKRAKCKFFESVRANQQKAACCCSGLNFIPELIFRSFFRLGELIRADSGVYWGHNANAVGCGAKHSVTVWSAIYIDTSKSDSSPSAPPECSKVNEYTSSSSLSFAAACALRDF